MSNSDQKAGKERTLAGAEAGEPIVENNDPGLIDMGPIWRNRDPGCIEMQDILKIEMDETAASGNDEANEDEI